MKEQLLLVLKPYDLSIEQFNVLRILRGQKGHPINLQDVQARMVNKMSNTTRLIDKLIKKEFVKRNQCETNRRKIEIYITKQGLDILNELDLIVDTTEKDITSNLSQTELEQLNTLLKKLKQ
ncbi:MAG: MarR family transcriptional regulator [Psychroserpens sp.]|nr:MarR family transcriptional regulator [Psychroserpens sp.]